MCLTNNDTDVAHYNFHTNKPILVIFGRDVVREYAINGWFVISPLITNVSKMPGKHEPQ